MKHLSFIILTTNLLYAGQSLITGTGVGTVTYPSTTPYTNVSDVRIEIRLTDLSACKSTSGRYGDNLLRIHELSLGCTEQDVKSLAVHTEQVPAPVIATSEQLGEATDVILRLQKLTSDGVFVAEVWSTQTRELLASANVPSGDLATRSGSIAGSQVLLPGTADLGTTNIAWIRVYNTTLPTGLPAPDEEDLCDTSSNCIARWEFEGDLAGAGFEGAVLDLILDSPIYAPTEAPVSDDSTTLSSISGRITPVPAGVGVMVYAFGPVMQSAVTDSLGNYRITGLASGTYKVLVSKAGLTFSPAYQTVTLNGTQATANFSVTTQTTQSWVISGVVTGSAATLTVSGTVAASTTTTSTGTYEIRGLSNGSYVVAPSRPGYTFSPSTATVQIQNGSVSGINFTARPVPPTVTLKWAASTSANVTTYNVYRSTVTGGPYTRLNSSPIAALWYSDSSVSNGKKYFYVATSVDSNGKESNYSSEAAAVVP